jgi:hypothetical protein
MSPDGLAFLRVVDDLMSARGSSRHLQTLAPTFPIRPPRGTAEINNSPPK